MKLNLDILFYEISQKAFCQLFGALDRQILLSNPEPLLSDTLIKEDVIYLCLPADINTQTLPGSYICAGRPECIPSSPGISLISVEDTTHDMLLKLIVSVFRKYAEWDNALLTALNASEPLKDMVKCSEKIINNPISVMGCDFHMLVQPPDQIEEYIARYTSNLDGGYLPLNIVNYYKQDPYYKTINEKRGAFQYTSELLPFQSMCVNLLRNNELSARIVVFEIYNLFRTFDGFLLEHLAQYMEPICSYSGIQLMPDLRGLRGSIISLLDGIGERKVTGASLSARGWSSTDQFIWLHLLQTEHDANNRTAQYTCLQIERFFPQTCAVQWSGGISVIVNLSKAELTPDEYLDRFEEFSQKCGLRTGASHCFVGVGQLVDYHKQAMIAAAFGKERSPDKWLYEFTEYAVHYLLANGSHGLPAKLCCHPHIQVLWSYDADNGTEYIKTLRCFLENHMNIIETARELFIHRSTMIYRLTRLKELCGIDWKDKKLIFYLMLSLKILSECDGGNISLSCGGSQ